MNDKFRDYPAKRGERRGLDLDDTASYSSDMTPKYTKPRKSSVDTSPLPSTQEASPAVPPVTPATAPLSIDERAAWISRLDQPAPEEDTTVPDEIQDTSELDAQHKKWQKTLDARNKQANKNYQEDAVTSTFEATPLSEATEVIAQEPTDTSQGNPDDSNTENSATIELREEITPKPIPEVTPDTGTVSEQEIESPSEEDREPLTPQSETTTLETESSIAPTRSEEKPVEETAPQAKQEEPASPEPHPSAPVHELAQDVADSFTKHFSLDKKALEETPGFQNLTEAQQRLVLERFASLVRENIHTKAVREHLETVDTAKRVPATTRFGKLKRAVRTGWHTTTRSYQIGKQEAALHEKWMSSEGGKETEKLRLLAELSQTVIETNAFGVDARGHTNFTENEGSLKNASELLNVLIRTKPSLGEKGAQERLAKLNETIALGIDSMRMSLTEKMSPEDEREFEKMAADWALRARKEGVLGTFLEKNRSLEETLQSNEAARGFAHSTLLERGGLVATGLVGRGVLGTLCGFIEAPIVGAGIGGFMGWRRKGIAQSDTDLLARMGEKIPTTDTSSRKSDISPAHLQVLRKGVAERLAKAKTVEEKRVLNRRLAEYDTQLRTHDLQKVGAIPSESAFGFDNGNVLNEKLLRLAKEYAQAAEELQSLSQSDVDLDLLEAKRVQTEKLADRLAARTDYTQKRLMQQRVDIGGPPATRAGMLANLAAALGTAETTLSMNDKSQQVKIQAHLNDVSAVLAGRDKNVDKARLRDKKRAALEGAALGAGFAVAGAALADIFQNDSAIKGRLHGVFPTSETSPNAPLLPIQKDEAAFEALIEKHSTSVPEIPIVPVQPIVTETVVGGAGGKQILIEDWNKTPTAEPVQSFTERRVAVEEALRQKPVPRPTSYNIPNWEANYNSPAVPRHFPESWARGTEALQGGHRADVESFFRAPTAPNPVTLETLATVAHETPADAQRVMDFYQRATEGKSSAFAQHIREEYTLKARLALKYPELTADIARMHPQVDDATMQSLVKMTKGAYLNGKSNPFMYAQSGVTNVPQNQGAIARMSNELDRMKVTFHRDAQGKIAGYDVTK